MEEGGGGGGVGRRLINKYMFFMYCTEISSHILYVYMYFIKYVFYTYKDIILE